MTSRARYFLSLATAALFGAALVSGCAGWPVQEMSNARQAIVAAQKAGAGEYAPDMLAEAQKLLAAAKTSANQGDYRAARDQAEQAREKAIEARKTAEAAKAPATTPKGGPDPTAKAGAGPHP
jgi:hypothetical protein